MTLLTPAWLLLSAFAGLVFLLHMRRRNAKSVPSTMLWRHLQGAELRRRRLQRPRMTISLLLQLLLVGLIALALAQPILGADHNDDHTIFVIDASGSMRSTDVSPSRFEAARAYLDDRMDAIGEHGGLVSVIAAGSSPAILVARQQAADARTTLESRLSVTDGKANWRDAVAWIDDIARQSESTRLVIATDAPIEAESAAASIASIEAIDLEAITFHGAATRNVGLVSEVKADASEPGAWRIEGQVVFAGGADMPIEVEMLFRRAGTNDFLDWGSVTADPAEQNVSSGPGLRAVPFAISTRFPGAGDLWLRLPSDANPSDDSVRYVLHDETRLLRVLLVGRYDENLVRALSAMDDVELAATASLPESDSGFDLIVVNDVVVDRRPTISTLWLGGSAIASETPQSLSGPFEVTHWRSDHPLSSGIDWPSLADVQGHAVATLESAAVVLGAGPLPLIQARTTPAGREVRVAIDIGDWANETGFPLFLANLLDWLNVPHGEPAATACMVGEPCSLPANQLTESVEDADGDIVWNGNGLWRTTIPDGVDRSFVPQRAGFYSIDDGGEHLSLAVNPPPLTETAQGAGRPSASMPPNAAAQLPLHVWLIVAILVLLIAEAWLAGRGRDRFLRREALAADAPLSRRRRAVLALRVVAIAATVAALLNGPFPDRSPSQAIVIVSSGTGDAAMIANGATPGVAWITPHTSAGSPTRTVADAGTVIDYERKVTLAAAMIPEGQAARIVLVDSTIETAGAVGAITPMIALRDISLDVFAIDQAPTGDVLVSELSTSPNVREGDRVRVSALVVAEHETQASISVFAGGVLVASQNATLVQGPNPVEVLLPEPVRGDQLIELLVEAAGDPLPENNRSGVWVNVGPPPSILVLASDELAGTAFTDLLAVQGLAAEIRDPEDAPRFLDGWLEHDVVVMMNVPAIALSTRQQDDLRLAVDVHGRGLLILGGENSFGPGGYYETALEALSPLSSRIPHETPRAALAFVLDRSGSMQAIVEEGITRLTIAKEATLGALDLLNRDSEVSVVAFDSAARVVVPIQMLGDGTTLPDALAPLEPGGGTALYPALESALEELAQAESATKHIVVLTDGLVEPIDFGPLLDIAIAEDVTISTIAIGQVPRTDRLEVIAAAGQGTFHTTGDVRALPAIMSQEALMLMSSPFKEETTSVAYVGDEPAEFLVGLPATLPPIESYVETTAKPTATQHLVLLADDETVPLLATWRYGLGEVIAFAAHGAGPGTAAWLQLPQYPLLWAQAIRRALPTTPAPGLHATARRTGDEVVLIADIISDHGEPMSSERVIALPADDFGAVTQMEEIAPGRYRAIVALTPGQLSSFEIVAGDRLAKLGVYSAYPARYDFSRTPVDIAALAEATGGEIVTDLSALLDVDTVWSFAPERESWLLIALLLFLADLILRDASALGWRRRMQPPATVTTSR